MTASEIKRLRDHIDAEITRAFAAWMAGDETAARQHMQRARLYVVDGLDALEGNLVTCVTVVDANGREVTPWIR